MDVCHWILALILADPAWGWKKLGLGKKFFWFNNILKVFKSFVCTNKIGHKFYDP